MAFLHFISCQLQVCLVQGALQRAPVPLALLQLYLFPVLLLGDPRLTRPAQNVDILKWNSIQCNYGQQMKGKLFSMSALIVGKYKSGFMLLCAALLLQLTQK